MKRRFAPLPQEFIQKEQFGHEKVYCESPHNPEDVLCYGSDDDAYDDPVERELRIEHQANRFLHGLPMLIASAALRGPFERRAGWENPWGAHNSVTHTPGRPHKRIRTSAASIPNRRPGPDHPPPPSSRHVTSSQLPQDQPSSPVHEYMDNVSFGRVKSWRDSVAKVTQVGRTEVETPLIQASSARTSRVSRRTPREPVSSQVVGDSFASSQNVQPSYTQAERRRTNVSSHSITPRPLIQDPEPSRSERAVSSLRNYPSLATTPATPARQSPEQVQPQPVPDLADKERERPEESTVDVDVDDASSSDLSDLSQLTPEPPQYEAPPESVSSSSRVSIKQEAEEVVVAPAKNLSAIRLQEYSDRSFRFRNVASRRDLAAETISSYASRRTPVRVLKMEIEEDHEAPEINSVPTLSRMIPQSSNHGVTLVTKDTSPAERPEDSIVLAEEAEVPEAYPSHTEHVEVDATHVASLAVDGDASMIDGPTLIPSTVSSDSELSDVESMGNFSCEKQSQALLQEMAQLPRRLLWPKAGKGSADTSLSSDPGTSEAEMTKGSRNTDEETTGTSNASVQRSGSPKMAEEIVVDKATTDEGFKDDCSEQTDDEQEEEANIDGGCTTLGTPLPERHEEQSPWRNSQIEVRVLEEIVAEPIETEEPMDAAGHVSPTSAKASLGTESQSPWTKEPSKSSQTLKVPQQPEASPVNRGGQTSPFVSGQVSEKTSQSPWAKGDSQIAAATLPDQRFFNPLSSPAKSTNSPLKEIALPNLSTLPPRDQGEMSNSQEACPPVPSTPEFKESNLPTPEYTHPIKSFREFLTPSPQKPRKRRRISAVNDGQFPSTQVLVDAAVSNPWLEPSQRNSSRKRKQLRVSWAPLPGEVEEEDSSILVAEDASPAGAEFPEEPKVPSSIKIRPKSILRTSRASSPPPRSLPKDIPTSEKFGKHFAAMANRRVTKPNSSNTIILPGASQQNCDSPQLEAMAERFLAADALSSRPRAISVLSEGEICDRELQSAKSRFIYNRISSSQISTPIKPAEANQDKDSDVELCPGEVVFYIDDEDEEEPEFIDPVNDVMQNLDSFLDDTWGFGQKELETPASGGEPQSSGSGSRRRSGGLRSSGVMDTPSLSNVWS